MLNLTIGDLVKRDEQAEFRNDVQLSSYDEPERNLSLVQSYLFTAVALPNRTSTIGLLDELVNAFTNERLNNRFVAVANYGHGKSHLALVLTNYFAKPKSSPEVKKLLEKIEQPLRETPAKAQRFLDFKDNRGEFLVVRLRGDGPNLREQFLSNLEKALREHEATDTATLPFWFTPAEKWLSELTGEPLAKAKAYLAQQNTEVLILLQDVRNKRESAYEQCLNLFRHLHGVLPNFGGEIGLKEAAQWAIDTFCGTGKPLGGLLIVFDEFSLYIQRHAERNAAGELQDLLNGVDTRQGKAVFLAFAQHSPLTVAEHIFAVGNQLQRGSLIKELNRIPKEFVLYTLLESVIRSYLRQAEDRWQTFVQSAEAKGLIAQASYTTLARFSRRYETTLRWNSEQFDQIVTKGCFPLHPLTTALLCNLSLQEAATTLGTPRTILGFLLDQLDQRKSKSVFSGKRINWVLPIELVDFFETRLPQEHLAAYQATIARIVPDPEEKSEFSQEEQQDVLKALLLQKLSDELKNAHDSDQIDLISTMVSLPEKDSKRCLRLLSDLKIIDYDPTLKKYSLWTATFNPHRIEEVLSRKLSESSLEWEDWKKLGKERLTSVPVEVPWGHKDDWQATEYLMPRQFFTTETLKGLIYKFASDSRNGITDGMRGCVVWLVAQNEDDTNYFRQNAKVILDQTFAEETPVPIVTIIPNQPTPSLFNALQRKKALEAFNQQERDDAGKTAHERQVSIEDGKIMNDIDSLRGGDNYQDIRRNISQYVVPLAYRAATQQIIQTNLYEFLKQYYAVAYKFSPPRFFKQYALNSRNFRGAVKTVAIDLLNNDTTSLSVSARKEGITRDLIADFLKREWKLVTDDHAIKEPNDARIAQAWDVLDQAFPSGGKEKLLREIIPLLLNPPYGYDYHTFTLLFCAWCGLNRRELQVIARGAHMPYENLSGWLGDGPQKFILGLCLEYVALERRDAGELRKDAKAIDEKLREGTSWTKVDAQTALVKLQEFVSDQRNDASSIESVQHNLETLMSIINQASEYEKRASQLLALVDSEKSVSALLKSLDKIGDLPLEPRVIPEGPKLNELRIQLLAWVEKVVEAQCAEHESIKDRGSYELKKRELQRLKHELETAQLPTLNARTERARQTLDRNLEILEAREREKTVLMQIEMMRPQAGLSDLRQYDERLQSMTDLSDEVAGLRDKKLRAIQSEIDELETLARTAQTRLEGMQNKSAVEQWREQLMRYERRFEGTDDFQVLQDLLEKTERLKMFFEQVEGELLFARRNLTSPTQANEIKRRIAEAGVTYQAVLSPLHQQSLEQVQAQVDEQVTQQEKQAISWLENLEKTAATLVPMSELVQLQRALETPPLFLPSSYVARLEALQKAVAKRLDENLIEQIATKFVQLQDRQAQEACLAQLRQLLKE
jgi:hypothetical protein